MGAYFPICIFHEDGSVSKKTYCSLYSSIYKWIDGWTDKQIVRQAELWTDGQTNKID